MKKRTGKPSRIPISARRPAQTDISLFASFSSEKENPSWIPLRCKPPSPPSNSATPTPPPPTRILRTCVHCGFCTATCPTFVLLGDELDSPRGRIYLIKDMLECGRPATEEVVRHVDRCLSCLSCMTTCPSGVNYMHLVDHARRYIEESYKRPWHERWLRAACWRRSCRIPPACALRSWAPPWPAPLPAPSPATSCRPAPARPAVPRPPRPAVRPSPLEGRGPPSARRTRRGRVALLAGCAQQVLSPAINEATIRLLTRLGIEVVVAKGAGCCGALTHHMGDHDQAMAWPPPTSTPGSARPRARASTPSSSTPQAAAPR